MHAMSDSTQFEAVCPLCNGRIDFPGEIAGRPSECPQCGKWVTLPSVEAFASSSLKLAEPELAVAEGEVEGGSEHTAALDLRLSGVPKPLRAAMESELDPGERPVWIGQPAPNRMAVATIPLV